jgi:hypothetical protein
VPCSTACRAVQYRLPAELPELCHPIRLYCREDRNHG